MLKDLEERRAYQKAYYAANREKLKARSAEWKRNNPERRSKQVADRYATKKVELLAQSAEYRKAHPEVMRAWRAANRDLMTTSERAWRAANPDRVLTKAQNRRARKVNAEGQYTAQDWIDIKARHNNRCAYCKQPKKLTVDHIIPLARGGSNWPSNIQPLCRSCNSSKGASMPIAA